MLLPALICTAYVTFLAALVTPPLTTCRVPRYEIGAQAMRLLLERIKGCEDECEAIFLPPTLVVRASAPQVQRM